MILTNQQQLDAYLCLIETTVAAIRSGTGLTAYVPEQAGTSTKSTSLPKTSKKLLKQQAAVQLSHFLNRPDFINYIKT